MTFSLNSPWGDPDVAALLGSVADKGLWRLVVDKAGTVSLLDCQQHQTPFHNLHCYFETYVGGNGYVGSDAAADAKHVRDVAGSLRRNWPKLERDAYIDH